MNTKDPKQIALQFVHYITRQDIDGYAILMTDDRAFIDHDRKVGKSPKNNDWKQE